MIFRRGVVKNKVFPLEKLTAGICSCSLLWFLQKHKSHFLPHIPRVHLHKVVLHLFLPAYWFWVKADDSNCWPGCTWSFSSDSNLPVQAVILLWGWFSPPWLHTDKQCSQTTLVPWTLYWHKRDACLRNSQKKVEEPFFNPLVYVVMCVWGSLSI